MGRCLSLFCPSRFPQSVKLRGFGGRAPEMFQRRLIPQAAVGPLLVIVAVPSLDLLCSILQAQKPVLIQALLSEAAVKRFDEGIIRGLAGAGEVQDYAMSVSPQVNFLGDKLRAVVQPDAFRHPIVGHRQVGAVTTS